MHDWKKIEMICRCNSIATPFGTPTENSITRAQTLHCLIMASISQNLPRTFYKLADKWDKKVGARNFDSACWTLSSLDAKDPIHRVAYMMSQVLRREHVRMHSHDSTTLADRFSELAKCFRQESNVSVECQLSSTGQVWIYDMRHSDSLPKSQTDTERLYRFVRVLISQWFNAEEEWYLDKNIHIAVCFFVWYLTKPNFFYKDNVTKQTTRYGIQRVWTPLLLGKKMKLQKEPVNAPAPKSQFSNTTDALLPKQQQQQGKLRKDIVALVASTTLSTASLEWDDPRHLHHKISECLANTDSGLSIKQNKKLQKTYNEYTTITAKINKTMGKIHKVERANAKIVIQPKEPVWDAELGSPPMSPPELIRKSACEGEPSSPVECPGCATGQANQLAHMGGCLPDELAADTLGGEEDVPDSWEDL
jgi:hypothetical protein